MLRKTIINILKDIEQEQNGTKKKKFREFLKRNVLEIHGNQKIKLEKISQKVEQDRKTEN